MNRFVAYFIRCLVILLGYAVAVLAASAFINVLFLGAIGFSAEETRWMASGPLVVTIPLLAIFIAYFAFAPSALLILAAEVLARRDWLFYALGGGVAAGIVLGVAWQSGDPDFAVTDTRVILGIIGAGMVGGIFYWLCAGRWAASWWSEGRPPTSPGPSGS